MPGRWADYWPVDPDSGTGRHFANVEGTAENEPRGPTVVKQDKPVKLIPQMLWNFDKLIDLGVLVHLVDRQMAVRGAGLHASHIAEGNLGDRTLTLHSTAAKN
ncbi:hypothetical protein [Kitasatospora sp. NPDC002040]|uniref:hypothetical protein n=1 Tax=Kitasatospora sp. NPDC002040 TaxID=3154661 RepID=UPI00332434DF